MKIQDKINRRTTVIELSVAEFLVLIALAAWGVGAILQQIGL